MLSQDEEYPGASSASLGIPSSAKNRTQNVKRLLRNREIKRNRQAKLDLDGLYDIAFPLKGGSSKSTSQWMQKSNIGDSLQSLQKKEPGVQNPPTDKTARLINDTYKFIYDYQGD